MKFAVIGGTGLIGSQVVEILNAAGHQAVPHSLSTGVDLVSGQGCRRSRGGRRRRRQPDELPDLRRRLARLLPVVDGQPPRRKPEGRRRTYRHPLDRRRRPGARAGLLPGQGAPGRHPQGRSDPVLHRARHAVHRVHGRDPVLDHRRRHRPSAAHTAPADRRRGRRRASSPRWPPAPRSTASSTSPDPTSTPSTKSAGSPSRPRATGRSVVTDDTAGMFAAVHGDVLIARDDARIAPTHYADWLS